MGLHAGRVDAHNFPFTMLWQKFLTYLRYTNKSIWKRTIVPLTPQMTSRYEIPEKILFQARTAHNS